VERQTTVCPEINSLRRCNLGFLLGQHIISGNYVISNPTETCSPAVSIADALSTHGPLERIDFGVSQDPMFEIHIPSKMAICWYIGTPFLDV